MNPTLRSWLLGLLTVVLTAALTAALQYLTTTPPDAAVAGLMAGGGFAAGLRVALRGLK